MKMKISQRNNQGEIEYVKSEVKTPLRLCLSRFLTNIEFWLEANPHYIV